MRAVKGIAVNEWKESKREIVEIHTLWDWIRRGSFVLRPPPGAHGLQQLMSSLCSLIGLCSGRQHLVLHCFLCCFFHSFFMHTDEPEGKVHLSYNLRVEKRLHCVPNALFCVPVLARLILLGKLVCVCVWFALGYTNGPLLLFVYLYVCVCVCVCVLSATVKAPLWTSWIVMLQRHKQGIYSHSVRMVH